MTDRPIIFSAPMIRALIEGRKTQTRRVLKPQPVQNVAGLWVHPPEWTAKAVKKWGGACQTDDEGLRLHLGMKGLPYAPGDRLWVKETWKPGAWREDARVAVDYRATPDQTQTPWINLPETADWETLWHRWTDEVVAAGSLPDGTGMHQWQPGQSPMRWRSPRFMPRWASRLTLTVTEVRVQRLQAITGPDAMAEGIDVPAHLPQDGADLDHALRGFRTLWNSIHGPDAWNANPWVCALTFTVRQGNIDA